MLKGNWVVYKDIDSLSKELSKEILEIAKKSIKLNGNFTIVLAGGGSVLKLYKILSQSISDWGKWFVYIGDERCLPIQDKNRNDHIINDIWLNNSQIPKKNIFFIKTELGCDNSANDYEKVLKNIASFDIVLLSIGEDGHTASLFPKHRYDNSKSVVVEYNSPKYPKERVSMSYLRLNQASNVFKVVSGVSKQRAVKLWLEEKKLPINQIKGLSEKVYICKDALPVTLRKTQVN
jgi:6-phosphogluconolactonase